MHAWTPSWRAHTQVLEAPTGENAFGVVRLFDDRVVIDGRGTTVTDRDLPIGRNGGPRRGLDCGGVTNLSGKCSVQ